MTKRLFLRAAILSMAFALWGGREAGAQGAPPGEAGFQPNRDYLALLPFETIDSASNNVILTFTDLVLPGNGGRELRFERVFSNNVTQDPSGPQWRFGIAGVPMRVFERPAAAGKIEPAGNIQAERLTTPYFWTLDGSRLETTYTTRPGSPGWDANRVQTPHFWRYERDTRVLRVPDGTAARYDAETGNLVKVWGPFDAGDTNVVTLTWGEQLEIVQSLGNGQTRSIVVEWHEESGLPGKLSYGNHSWTYEYDVSHPGRLLRVVPPAGPSWAYEYSSQPFSAGKVTRVTTPQGGAVEYVYEDREFPAPGTPAGAEVFNVLVARRVLDLGRTHEWTFEPSSPSDPTVHVMSVTLPSETRLIYVYGAHSVPSNVLAGGWALRFRYVQAPDGSTLETEEREYNLFRAAREDEGWGVLRPVARRTSRGGRTYATELEYATGAGSTIGCVIGWNFHNFHRPTTIRERGPGGVVRRTTELAYDHFICPNLLALPRRESTTVAGMTAVREWSHNEATGFLEREILYGIPTVFTPDAFGNIATSTKANGKATAFTYSWGMLESTSTPGVAVAREINPNGTVASETVAGRTTTYLYDDLLRLVRTMPPGGTNPILTTYDNAGAGWWTTSRGNSFLTTALDGFGRPIATENGAGVRTHTTYDGEGRTTYRSFPFEGEPGGAADVGTWFVYDRLGRVTQEVNPDATVRTRVYDDSANTVTVYDEENRSTVFSYHAFGHPDDGRLAAVVDADGQEWAYEYDAIGNLARVVTPTGHTRTWLRNGPLLASETHPESGTVSYTHYDAAGVLKRKVDANGTEFVFVHDASDRVRSIAAGGRVTTFAYESGSDRLVSMSNGDVSTTFEYHSQTGRLQERRDDIGAHVFTSTYAYDGNEQVTAITYPSGRVIEYDRQDPEGRITRVVETAAGRDHAFGMLYHPSGGLRGYTSGNLLSTTIDYDPRRYWVTGIRSGALGLAYGSHDAVGNVRAIVDSRGTAEAFTYDALDRLVTADGPYGFAGYAYDAHGNRQTSHGIPYSYEPNTLRLAGFNGIPFAYDGNGNLQTAGGSTFGYTQDNMLSSATVNGVTTAYAYDADRWRTRRTEQGATTYFLRGLQGELLTEWRIASSGASTVRDYVYAGGRLLSVVEGMASPPASHDTYGTITPNGPAVTAAVSTPGRRVLLSFQGVEGHRYRAYAGLTSGQMGCGPWLELRTAAGDLVANASTGGCTALVLDAVVLPASGTYHVVVDPLDANSGSVSVRLYDIHAVIVPNGPKLTVPANTSGRTLLVEFDGVQGWQYSALAQRLGGIGIGCSYQVTIRVVNWAQIATTGESYGCDWVLRTMESGTLPSTRLHFLELRPISTSGHNSADVWLHQFTDVATAIQPDGMVVPAAMPKPGQRALLPFSGAAGLRVAARVQVTGGNLGCAWGLAIRKPDGTNFSSVGTCGGLAFHEPVSLAAAGAYRVVVNPKWTSTGTASVQLFEVPPDVAETLAINGPAVPVLLPGVGQRAHVTFPGASGQKVTIRLTNNTIGQVTVRLQRSSGQLVQTTTSSAGSFNLIQATLPITDTFTVVVDPYDLNTGSISVRVTSP